MEQPQLDDAVKAAAAQLTARGEDITVSTIQRSVSAGRRQINDALNRLGLDARSRQDLSRQALQAEVERAQAENQELRNEKRHLEGKVESLQAQISGHRLAVIDPPAPPATATHEVALIVNEMISAHTAQTRELMLASDKKYAELITIVVNGNRSRPMAWAISALAGTVGVVMGAIITILMTWRYIVPSSPAPSQVVTTTSLPPTPTAEVPISLPPSPSTTASEPATAAAIP